MSETAIYARIIKQALLDLWPDETCLQDPSEWEQTFMSEILAPIAIHTFMPTIYIHRVRNFNLGSSTTC